MNWLKKRLLANREILRLAIPSIISNITVPLLGIVDVAIVGHIGDENYIGAIAIGSMIFNVIYWLFGFLRMGTSGFTSQAFGAGNTQATAYVLRKMLVLSFGVAAAFVLFQLPIRHLAFLLMGVNNDIHPLVATYYNIVVWGAPATLGLYVLTGWLVGMQNTRVPMWVSIAQNIINIAASALLVFAFHMGIAGVAIGTLVAQWAGFVMSLLSLRSCYAQEWHTTLSNAITKLQSHTEIFTISFFSANRDIFLRTLCLVSVNLFFTAAGSRQGAMMLSVNTLLMTFFTLFSYVMDGFAYAGEALAGRYFGARDSASLNRLALRLLRWGMALSVAFSLIYLLAGEAILGLLTDKQPVVVAAADYRLWAVMVPLTGFAAFVFDGIFIGITATRAMFMSCFVGAIAFFLIYYSLFGEWHNHALWLALNLYLALRGVVLAVVFMRGNKQKTQKRV
ncbi:MAG: MATE family efflux transporter [Prevotella sp.]|nr:MATE family efflux transporter [Prevotella sp.]